MKRWLTVKETMQILHRSEKYIYIHIKDGDFISKRGKRKEKYGKPLTLINTLSVCRYLCEEYGVYARRDRIVNLIRESEQRERKEKAEMDSMNMLGFKYEEFPEEDLVADTDWMKEFIEENTEYWGIEKVAVYLGVSEKTVRNYIKRGWLKEAKSEGRKKLYNSFDVIELYWSLHTDISIEDMKDPVKKQRKYNELAMLLFSDPLGINAISRVLNDITG